MLNLRKPSLRIGLMILAFCGSALDTGSFSTAFGSTQDSISYPGIVNSSELILETLPTDSPTQVAQAARRRTRRLRRRSRQKPCRSCRCKKSRASRRQKSQKYQIIKQIQNKENTNSGSSGYETPDDCRYIPPTDNSNNGGDYTVSPRSQRKY